MGSIAGVGLDGRPLVTKTSFRFLQTLNNLGAAPEPNLTVLWSQNLPQGFKDFCSKTSIATSSVQYENDDMMRSYWEMITVLLVVYRQCVSVNKCSFWCARQPCQNLLLYAINGGRDEVSGDQIGPLLPAMSSDVLDYDEVMQRFCR